MIEICLILLGVVTVVASFMIGEKFSPSQELAKEKIAELLEQQFRAAETQFHDVARQLSEDMQEATERELEKICNEKIMAIHEESDTAAEEIEKNHKEVVFLYSMLDDKKKELEELTVSLRKETKETRELVQDLMLSKEITHMLEQEITIGRDAISELKKLLDGTDVTLALAEDRIERLDERLIDLHQLDEKLVDLHELDEKLTELQMVDEKLAELQILDEKLEELQQLDEKLAELQQVDERLDELQQVDEKLAELQQVDDKLDALQQIDEKLDELRQLNEKLVELYQVNEKLEELQQLDAQISLRQKEERERIEAIKKAKKAAEQKAAAKRKAMKADSEEVVEKPVAAREQADIQIDIMEATGADSEAEEPTVKRTPVRRRKAEEKDALLSGVRTTAVKKVSGLEAEENNFNQRILRMYRAGMTETEIAKSLSLGVGEVRLVIGLFEGAKV